MKIKIVSNKKYRQMIDSLGAKIQYCSLNTNAKEQIECIHQLNKDGGRTNVMSASSATRLIEQLDAKLDKVLAALK